MKLKILSVILFACFALSSCSDDEADFNNNILGTWIPVIEETETFPVDKVINIFNPDRTGTIKYVTYTDKDTYTERFSLNMNKIYFVSENEISVTSDTYHINNDGSIKVSTNSRSTYSHYIEYLDSDSLVYVDNHDNNKKWHYTKLQ